LCCCRPEIGLHNDGAFFVRLAQLRVQPQPVDPTEQFPSDVSSGMNINRHLRILSLIYLILSAPVFVLGALVTLWAAYEGGEGGLIALPAMLAATVAFLPMVAGIGLLLWGANWAMALAVMCALPMLPSVILTPLAIYTFFVAYHRWSKPYEAPPAPVKIPMTVDGVREALSNASWPMEIRAHARILGSLWILVAILPLYMGAVIFAEGISEFGDEGWTNLDLYSGPVFLLLGTAAAAIARGVIRQRMWALAVATLCALPLLGAVPVGTLLAAYTLFVAWLAWRAPKVATE
jgi:hypothetical protein